MGLTCSAVTTILLLIVFNQMSGTRDYVNYVVIFILAVISYFGGIYYVNLWKRTKEERAKKR